MNIEDQLKEALSAHVSHVRAPAMMGQAVRRKNRAHVLRFRTAGAAALTVVVAGAFPAYTALTSAPATAPGFGGPAAAPSGPGDPQPVPAEPSTPSASSEPVPEESSTPSASPEGVNVASPQPVSSSTPEPTAAPTEPDGGQQETSIPQDLGDLGDGREFGGIRVGYLPDKLVWGRWSGKNGFGTTSYTTSYNEPGAGPGLYGVQIVVLKGAAAKDIKPRLRAYRDNELAKRVTVRGAGGAIANLGEGSEVVDTEGTPTIVWFLRRDIAVEVMMSPVLAEKFGSRTEGELIKIANSVRITT